MLNLHHLIRRRIFSQSTAIIFSSSSSHSSKTAPAKKNPPRKGRQATRRLLKLLSPSAASSQDDQDPNLINALNALETTPHALSPSQAAALISAVANPLLSFDLYRFLRSSGPSFRPDSSLFSALLRSQLRSLSPHPFRIRFYFDQMRKYGVRLAPVDFRALFAPLFPENPALGRSFLDQLMEATGPDSEIYAQAVSVYVEHGMVEEAVEVAERARVEIEYHGLEFYSNLMCLYRVTGDARTAMEAFLEMEERGVSADEGICQVLLGILCGVGWVKLCWVVLEETTRQIGFKPDESLGLDLMRAFLKRGMVHEAEWLFREGILKEKGSFLLFSELMAEKKMPLVAFELLKSMGNAESCAASLICGCGKLGLVEEAEKIFGDLRTSVGTETGESLYSSMVYVYSRAGLRRKAEMVWEKLEASGGSSEEACLHMMTMYGEMGLLGDVVKVFDRWKETGCYVNVDGYVVLIDALIKAGKLNQAKDCLMEMRKSGIHPTSLIYFCLMEGYLRAGLLNHAVALLEEYKVSGLSVEDGSTASSLVQILIRMGRYADLRCYLDGFRKSGIKISREKGAVLMELCRDDTCLRKIALLFR